MNPRQFLKATAFSGAGLIVAAVAVHLAAPPAGPPGVEDVAIDFAGRSAATGAVVKNFRFTRPSAKTDLLPSSPAGAAYRVFKAGVPAISPGKGMLIEEARDQLLADPIRPASQSVTLASPGPYTLWVNGAGRATLTAATATIAGAGVASQGAPLTFRLVSAGTIRIVVAGTLDAFQLEKGRNGTSLIPAKGARAADSLIPIGPLAAILSGDSGGVMVGATAAGATGPYANLVRIGRSALSMDFYDGGISGTNDGGDKAKTASLGVGRFRDGATALLAWTPAGRKLVAGGGVISRGPPLRVDHAGGLAIGANGKDVWNGYIRKVDAFSRIPSDGQLRAMTATAAPDIVVMGDSLTARNEGGPDGLSFPARLGAMLGRTVLNGGVGGDSSTQIARRYANAPELWGLPLIIWAGRNNYRDGARVEADIAEMAARNRSGKVLVLSVINGQLRDEESGGRNYAPRVALNKALSKTYGTSFVDVQAALVGGYDPLNPVDRLDRSVDRVPYTLRAINEGAARYYLPRAIDAARPAFEISSPVRPTFVMKVGQEYMLVQKSKGSQIADAVRGYGVGGAAAPHPALSSYSRTDPVHLNDRGRTLVARKVADEIKALGW